MVAMSCLIGEAKRRGEVGQVGANFFLGQIFERYGLPLKVLWGSRGAAAALVLPCDESAVWGVGGVAGAYP